MTKIRPIMAFDVQEKRGGEPTKTLVRAQGDPSEIKNDNQATHIAKEVHQTPKHCIHETNNPIDTFDMTASQV